MDQCGLSAYNRLGVRDSRLKVFYTNMFIAFSGIRCKYCDATNERLRYVSGRTRPGDAEEALTDTKRAPLPRTNRLGAQTRKKKTDTELGNRRRQSRYH